MTTDQNIDLRYLQSLNPLQTRHLLAAVRAEGQYEGFKSSFLRTPTEAIATRNRIAIGSAYAASTAIEEYSSLGRTEKCGEIQKSALEMLAGISDTEKQNVVRLLEKNYHAN